MMRSYVEHPRVQLLRLGEVLLLLQLQGNGDGFIDRQLPRWRIRRVHRYQTLLALRSNVKCSPASSEPSVRCFL